MLGDTLRRSKSGTPAEPPRRPPSRRGRFSFTWGRYLLAALVILLGSFGTGYLLSTQVLFPAPETAGSGIPVPELYELDREEAEGILVEAGLGVGRTQAIASLDVPAGRVIAQSPIPGQQLRRDATVDLVLSDGPPEVRIPPVEGLAADMARQLLEEAGFAVEIRQLPAPEPEGVVAGTDPGSGTTHVLPATVTLLVSIGPPRMDTSLVDSIPQGTP